MSPKTWTVNWLNSVKLLFMFDFAIMAIMSLNCFLWALGYGCNRISQTCILSLDLDCSSNWIRFITLARLFQWVLMTPLRHREDWCLWIGLLDCWKIWTSRNGKSENFSPSVKNSTASFRTFSLGFIRLS